MKYFIITVDTEGDNLWVKHAEDPVTTQNVSFIPRFQDLCEKYEFKPTYLTNYEMATDSNWVEYSRAKAEDGKCEIGLHLHAWNTPPFYSLENKFGGLPFVTEYPYEIMKGKVAIMMEILGNAYDMPIVSHRSGRWATNDTYFKILREYGIKYDCSITPGLNQSTVAGSTVAGCNDYRKYKNKCFYTDSGILEIPMSTGLLHMPKNNTIRGVAKALLKGNECWLRPINSSVDWLKMLTDKFSKNSDFVEFMVHSSELMPGGSPYFPDNESIEKLYTTMDELFDYIRSKNFVGVTLKEYGRSYENIQNLDK